VSCANGKKINKLQEGDRRSLEKVSLLEVRKCDVDSTHAYRLLHPKHTILLTCTDKKGKVNIITLAWCMPVSADPPMLAVSIRPTRHSYRMIEETKEFVINVPPADLLRSVWICGTKSGRDVDKFEETGLTRTSANEVSVPMIAECLAWLECRVADRIELGDHVLFVGEVLCASVRADAFNHVYRLGPSSRTLHHLGGSSFALSGGLVDAREGGTP